MAVMDPASRTRGGPTQRRSKEPVRRRSAAATPRAGRRIGIAFPDSMSHWHDVYRGTVAGAGECGWQVVADVDEPRPLSWWLRQPLDALIAAVTSRADERAARAARIPVVNVSLVLPSGGLPLVTFDNEAIGRLAADHLLEQAYERFAFFGLQSAEYSRHRLAGFAARLRERGLACDAFEVKVGATVEDEAAIDRWLASLATGTGVFATHDLRAMMLLNACRRIGIDVPGRIGVLGVGEFPEWCAATSPSLSSIRRNGHEVGRAACAALERLFGSGRRAAPPPVTVPPAGVTARESTAHVRGELPARAVRFIRDHIGERFDVAHLARKLRVSRRTLEREFQAAFGESPHVRLLRLRAEAARSAHDATPGTTLTAAARAAGFSSVRHLRRTLVALALPPFAAGKD